MDLTHRLTPKYQHNATMISKFKPNGRDDLNHVCPAEPLNAQPWTAMSVELMFDSLSVGLTLDSLTLC